MGSREFIPGVKGQCLSSGAGLGVGDFAFLVVACWKVTLSWYVGSLSYCRCTGSSLSLLRIAQCPLSPQPPPQPPQPPATVATLQPGALSWLGKKSECLSFFAALTQEITASFIQTKSKWAWQLLGRDR